MRQSIFLPSLALSLFAIVSHAETDLARDAYSGLLDPFAPRGSDYLQAELATDNELGRLATRNDPEDPDNSCSKTFTETSCKSLDSTSTSRAKTSSMLSIASEIATTTARADTGVYVRFDPDENQEDRIGRLAHGPPTPLPIISTRSTDSTPANATGPMPTAANGCAIMGGGQGVCWNKCDPGTGKPVAGTWEDDDPWCWLKAERFGAFCRDVNECPIHLECQPTSWRRGGCAKKHVVSSGGGMTDGWQRLCCLLTVSVIYLTNGLFF